MLWLHYNFKKFVTYEKCRTYRYNLEYVYTFLIIFGIFAKIEPENAENGNF